MALALAAEPALVLPGDLKRVLDGLLEGGEAAKRLHVLAEPPDHLQLLDLLAHLEEHGHLVALGVGPHG